jgi:translocation and assembly module TamB
VLLGLVLAAVAILSTGYAWLQTDAGRRWLADRIEAVASTPERRLEIGNLDGAIPFAPIFSRVSISDARGPWLTLDRALVRLNPSAVLDRVASFQTIELGRLAVLRPPSPSIREHQRDPTSRITWPSIPAALTIERLSVEELTLGEPFLGEPADFRIEGSAKLGAPREGLSLDVEIRRIDDVSGGLVAKMHYAPQTDRLTTKLRVDETEGGLLALLTGLENLPALTIDLAGDGTLDDWEAELSVDGGDQLRIVSPIRIKASAAGRRLIVNAEGRLTALVDQPLRPLIEPMVSLRGSVLLRPDDRLTIDRIALTGGFGVASLTGELDLADRTSDLKLRLVPAAADRFAGLIPGASWETLHLSALASGPLAEPALRVSLTGERVAYGEVALESFVSTLQADLTGPLVDTGSRIEVVADTLIEGMVAGRDVPPELLGPELRIKASGSVTAAGSVVADQLTVHTPAAHLSATGKGEDWGTASAALTGKLDVPDLARLGSVPGRSVAGEAAVALSVDWDGTAASGRGSLELGGLSTDFAAADVLVGPSPRIDLAASLDSEGAIEVEHLEVWGKGLALSASGALGADELGIDWQLLLADLAPIAPALEGSLAGMGRVTGTLADPAATAQVILRRARVAGIPVSEGRFEAAVTGLATQPAGILSLEARLADLPLRAMAALKFEDEGAVRIDALALRLASLAAEGAATLHPSDGTAEGKLSASIADLADLTPLMALPLSGRITADLVLSRVNGGQAADIEVSATGAGLPASVEIRRADLTLRLADLLGTPTVAAQLQAEGILTGAVVLDRAIASARGDLDALSIAMDLSGEQLAMTTRGSLALADQATTIEVAELRARYADVRGALTGPGRILMEPGGILFDGLAFRAEGGRLSANGRFGDVSDLLVTASDMPLELARLAVPDLELTGRLDGRFRLTGTRDAPLVSGELRASALGFGARREAGVRGLGVAATLDWDASVLRLDSTMTGDFGGPITAAATLTAPADPQSGLPVIDQSSSLKGSLEGNVRLGLLNDIPAARGDRIEGTLVLDLSLSGPLGSPRIGGGLSLSGGSYRGPFTGIALDDVLLRANGDGDRLTIAELSARTPNGGTIKATGSVGTSRKAGFPVAVAVRLDDALILDQDIVIATARGQVAAKGALARSLDVVGQLTIPKAEIQVPERLPVSIPTLEVTEINKPPRLAARRPVKRKGDGAELPLRVSLDLVIDAPGGIFVRGRGLDAEVGGEVTIRGTANAPDIAGGFALRRGHLNALHRRFDLSEGVVTLPEEGNVEPNIRLVARTYLGDGWAQITVEGRASAPQVRLESVPELPQDEILARILFGRRSGSLSELESIQLARAALELTGIGAGQDLLQAVGGMLGLNLIEIQDLDAGSVALQLRRRIGENINLDLRQGLRSGSTRAVVEIQLTPNISVETEVGSESTGRTGVRMEWEY